MTGRWSIAPVLFTVGLLSMSTQVYFLREALTVFYGNELVLGVVLALWMLITGIGALAGRYPADSGRYQWIPVAGLIIFSLLPLPTLLTMDYLRSELFIAGARVSLAGSMAVVSISIAPFCLLSGYLFTRFSGRYTRSLNADGAGKAYTIEAIGSLVAGLLVTFIFFWLFNAIVSLKIFTLAGIWITIIYVYRRPFAMALLFLLTMLIVILRLTDYTDRLLFPDQNVIGRAETPYGRVTVTSQHGQLSYYENGSLLFSSGNTIMNEESVHPAMLQHPDPQSVLMISGGLSGAIGEVRKYGNVKIDYLEQNPALIQMVKKYSRQLDQRGVQAYAEDPRSFVRHTRQRYDVVLISTSEPSSLEANRFYTLEWFLSLKSVMSSGGVVSIGLPTSSDYVSSAGENLNVSLISVLRKVFNHVLPVPLGKNYFLASDRPLSLNLPGLVAERGIPTLVVNGYYLDLNQLTERSQSLMKADATNAGLNLDFHPVTFLHQINYWLSYSGEDPLFLLLIPGLFLLLFIMLLPPRFAGIAAAGATGASLQALLLFSLQVLYGMIYQWVGVLILAFMTGLAAGSGISDRVSRDRIFIVFRYTLLCISVSALVIPVLLITAGFSAVDPLPAAVAISLLSFITGGLTGFLYGTGVRSSGTNPERIVAYAYSADLAGAAAGTMLVSLCLFPRYGLINTGILLALVCLIAWARTFVVPEKKL